MRHNVKTKKLAGDIDHKKALRKNLATQLILHEEIDTTLAKAKFVKPYIEKLITKCKGEAREVINAHVDFFTATIDKLVENGEIKPEDFRTLGAKHGVAIKVVPPKESVLSRYSLKLDEFKIYSLKNNKELTSQYNS